jgi:membrane protease subunit (stomatin/prohibitin family)
VLRIADPEVFLREVIGTDSTVTTEEIAELLRRIITLAFSDMIMATGLGVIELQGRQVELSDKLRDFVQERVDDEFGLKIDSVTMNITLPEEITQAMTRGVARGVEQAGYLDNVGPMDRLQQGAMAEAMVEAAKNPGGGAGSFMGAGFGMALGQQMGNMMAPQQQGGYAPPQQGGYPPPAGPPPLPQAQTFHAEINGQAAGPFTIDQLRQYVTAGQLNPNSNVWAPGTPNWVAAQTVPVLSSLFGPPAPPPLPPRGAPA